MDRIDRQLLALIQQDGRGSYARYGQQVGLSAAAVHDRLKKLSASGAVRNWSAVVDPVLAGLSTLAFVRVQIDLPANTLAFAEAVSGLPELMECHHTNGEWSCLLKMRAASPERLAQIISENLSTLPGVIRVQSETVTDTAKETHVLPTADTARPSA